MKRSNMKHVVMAAFFATTLCAGMMMEMPVQATQQNGNENLVSVIELHSGKAIHLNGNSVVIKESENDEAYINIYIDENRNGIVDGTEQAVALSLDERGETSDINASLPIYGLYNGTTSADPLVITVESGTMHSLYGVYGGTLNNTLKMNVKGGTFANGLYGVSTGTVSAGEGNVAVDIDVISNDFCKYFTGVQNSSKIAGNVDIDWNATELAPSDIVMVNFIGVENTVIEGDVNIYISKLRVEAIYGLKENASVNGSYTYKSEFDTSVTHLHYGMKDSTVYGDADITVHGAQTNNGTIPYVHGVSGFCSGSGNLAVKGTTKLVYTDGYSDILYILNAGNYGNVIFNNDVTVDVQAGNALNAEYIKNTNIIGSLNMVVQDGCVVSGNYKAFQSGYIAGNVKMKLYNDFTSDEIIPNYCSALYYTSVGGNADIEINGGCYNEIRPIYGGKTQYTVVSGELDLKVRNVTCYENAMMFYGVAEKDAELLIENANIERMYGLASSVAEGSLCIDLKTSKICNSGGNYSYMLASSDLPNGAQVNIMDTSFSNGAAFVPCSYNESGSGSVYLNVKNSTFDCAYYTSSQLVEGQKLYCTVLVDAKVGEETTVEKPLADLSGLAKVLVGSIDAECSKMSGLPEGLVFENGKLYGTPTVAYVAGKDATLTMGDDYNTASATIHFVVAKKDCEFDTAWNSDDKYHWHACTDADCDEVKDKATHTWDNGVVTKEATVTEIGTKTYTCTVCKATKTEEIPVKETVQNENVDDTTEDTTGNETEENKDVAPSAKGTVLNVNDKNGEYTVTNSSESAPEVSYKVVNKKAKEVVIPKTVTVDEVTYKVTSIQNGAFKNHKNLKKVTIGANVKKIGKDAFSGCKKLATVKMNKNVQSIGEKAFYNCTALKKIEIPSKVNKIGAKAFYNCKKLTSITIKTTKLTTKNVGKKAFTKTGSSDYKKLTVKVPKKKLKAYKTMLKKRGLSSKAKVKK